MGIASRCGEIMLTSPVLDRSGPCGTAPSPLMTRFSFLFLILFLHPQFSIPDGENKKTTRLDNRKGERTCMYIGLESCRLASNAGRQTIHSNLNESVNRVDARSNGDQEEEES